MQQIEYLRFNLKEIVNGSRILCVQVMYVFVYDIKHHPRTEQVEAASYFCEDSGVCHMQGAVLTVPLVCDKSCDTHVTSSITYQPSISS